MTDLETITFEVPESCVVRQGDWTLGMVKGLADALAPHTVQGEISPLTHGMLVHVQVTPEQRETVLRVLVNAGCVVLREVQRPSWECGRHRALEESA